MAQCVVEGDDERLKALARAARRAFAPSTVLGRELSLARPLVEGGGLAAQVAERLIENTRDVVVAAAADRRASRAQRRDARRTFEALGVVPASDVRSELVDALFSEWHRAVPDPVTQTTAEVAAVKMLQEPRQAAAEDARQRDPLAEKLMVERFNARYGRELSRSQQGLLAAVATDDTALIEGAVTDAVSSVVRSIDAHLTGLDPAESGLRGRLTESKAAAQTIRSMPRPEAVEGCMRLFALAAELESRDDA